MPLRISRTFRRICARGLHRCLEQAVKEIECEENGVVDPDRLAGILRQCAKDRDLENGKRIHTQIVKKGLEQRIFLNNLLVTMYGKCGRVQDAKNVFDRMRERNPFSWSLMAAAFAQNGHPEAALELYEAMVKRGVLVDGVTYATLLGACSIAGRLQEGRLIHERIVEERLDIDEFLGATLINMYGKCGCLDSARSVFQQIGKNRKDVVVWNAMISACTQNDRPREAVDLYHRMEKQQIKPDSVTLLCVLDACADIGDLEQGSKIRWFIQEELGGLSGQLGNAVVNLYGKCGRIDEARSVFDLLQKKNVVTWASMLTAYAQNGHYMEALQLYQEMEGENLQPNHVAFLSVLKACSSLRLLEQGRKIHQRIIELGLESELTVGSSLVDMYGKCLDLATAKRVFDRIMKRNHLVSWNAMVAAYSQNGCCREAMELVQRMDLEGFRPNRITFVSVLGACRDLRQGRMIHNRIEQLGLAEWDEILATAVVSMYGRCGSVAEAEMVFERLIDKKGQNQNQNQDLNQKNLNLNQELNKKNVISWNAMMNVYVENGNPAAALEMIGRILAAESGLQPDGRTFVAALEACSMLQNLEAGEATHKELHKLGLQKETIVTNALVTMYGRCGSLDSARNVLQTSGQFTDVISWNAMLAAYAQSGHPREVGKLYRAMLQEGLKPNEATFLSLVDACCSLGSSETARMIHTHIVAAGCLESSNSSFLDSALVNMYGKCGNLSSAMSVFDRMQLKDSVTWTTMISLLAHHGHSPETSFLFLRMLLEGSAPDAATLASVTFACSHAGSVKQGLEYFASSKQDFEVAPTFEQHIIVADMLGRAGRLEEAEELLTNMAFQPGVVSWRSLLSACSSHGNLTIGKRVADCIFELNPGDTSAVVLLSNMYTAAGMSDEAEKLKKRML